MNVEEYRKMFEVENKHWWFVGKHKTIERLIKNIIDNKLSDGKLKILDIGCGCGVLLSILKKHGCSYGVDISEEALNFCASRQHRLLCRADVQKTLPFKRSLFDLIVASDVLEHLDNDLFTLSEIYRLSKNNGYVLITVPSYKFLWSEHDIALDHRRRYEKEGLLNIIRPLGFRILKVSYTNFFPFPLLCLFRGIKKVLNKCTKVKPKSDFFSATPEIVNRIFLFLIGLEANLLKLINFPFGSSIICILQKESSLIKKD